MSRVSRIAYRYGEYLGARQAKEDKMVEESRRKAEERQAKIDEIMAEDRGYQRTRQEAADKENQRRWDAEEELRKQSLAEQREATKANLALAAEDKTYRRGIEAQKLELQEKRLNQEIAEREEAKSQAQFEKDKTDYVKKLTDAHIDKMETEGFFNLLENIDTDNEKDLLDIYNKEGQHQYKDITRDKNTGDVIFYHLPDETGKTPAPTRMKRHEIEGALDKRSTVYAEREKIAKDLKLLTETERIKEGTRARADVLAGMEKDIQSEISIYKDLQRALSKATNKSDKARLEQEMRDQSDKIRGLRQQRDIYNASRISGGQQQRPVAPVENSLAGAMDNLPDF